MYLGPWVSRITWCLQQELDRCPYRVKLSLCRDLCEGPADNIKEQNHCLNDCTGKSDGPYLKCKSTPCNYLLEQKLDKLTTELKNINTNKI